MPKQGNTSARGYGARHQRERAKWKPKVDAGLIDCWRCGTRLQPGQPWDLGHDDHNRNQYRGPEHPACNRATAGRRHQPKPWQL